MRGSGAECLKVELRNRHSRILAGND
jgi:hypothetical protein